MNPRDLPDPQALTPIQQILLSNISAQAAALHMPCYLVGGVARDLLLGKPTHDLDVIVEGNAIQLGKQLARAHGGNLTAHPPFGTAIWQPPNAPPLDLITARAETYPHPGALPLVTPSTIEDDLRRRDFTLNALALRVEGGRFSALLDPLHGQADLAQGIIRVLHPRSFMDDPTRIFRAVRYEQRYGFSIEDKTLALINAESLQTLAELSGERIRHELDLILMEENAALMLARLNALNVLRVFNLPALQNDFFYSSENALPEFETPEKRLSLKYLLWLANLSAEESAAIAQRLDFNAELRAALSALIQMRRELPRLENSSPSVWTFFLEKFPPLAVYALWLIGKQTALKKFLTLWRGIKPAMNGNDLKARGVPPGPRYKQILTRVRAAWLDGELNNAEEEWRFL
ncbi:MAG: hypothetical protein Fur002_07890 [Anaerolineales bacterium]